jgi:hypothetical protein
MAICNPKANAMILRITTITFREHPPRLTYRFTFAHRLFAAADIFARPSADIVHFRFPGALFTGALFAALFTTAFPFSACIAASIPANRFVSAILSA